MTKTAGGLILDARKAEGATLSDVARRMGMSIPYVHDVQQGKRRLASARWGLLSKALPGLGMRSFVERSVAEGPVEVDASALTAEQRGQFVDLLLSVAAAPAKRGRKAVAK